MMLRVIWQKFCAMRSLGYTALQFASAEVFLKSDSLHDTDCLISDVQMPSMNGIELQSKLIVQGYRLPIIFVTAFSEMRARAQALAAGAIGFLAKPFSDEELITCLNPAPGVFPINRGYRAGENWKDEDITVGCPVDA
jgi:FixJ family two-component response regulator